MAAVGVASAVPVGVIALHCEHVLGRDVELDTRRAVQWPGWAGWRRVFQAGLSVAVPSRDINNHADVRRSGCHTLNDNKACAGD